MTEKFETAQLRDAVDDLTLPKNVEVHTDNGVTWATEDPLLVQLREAVSSTLKSGSGSGGSPWSRNVLDSGALYRASIITSQIGEWCRDAHVTVKRDASVDLRAWFTARLTATEDTRLTDHFYIRKMHEWAGQIRDMVNPPKTVEITAPCPTCGQGVFTNDMGERVPNPLTLTYRPETGSIWEDARALCRACETVWDGQWRLRELRHDLDAKDNA